MLPTRFILIILVTAVTTTVINTAQAGFYRWVDDDGTIHYSDSLPPQESQRKQDILNEQGRTIKSIEAPKTIGELEEAARLAKLEEEKRKLQDNSERRDRTLLAMYLTVDDIELVRDERISTVESAIEITQLRKKKFIRKLKKLDASEQRMKKAGNGTPSWLTTSREHYQEQLVNVNEILDIKSREKLVIKKRFSGDINRYLELKQPDLASH